MRNLLSLLLLGFFATGCVVENETYRMPQPRDEPRPSDPTEPSSPPDARPPRPVPENPACSPDDYEPNDAQPAIPGGTMDGLTLDADDVDRFAITLFPGERISVEAWTDAEADQGDLDIYLLDGSTMLAASVEDGPSAWFEYTNPTDEPLVLTVEANLHEPAPDACVVYGLAIGVSDPPTADPGPPPAPPTPPPPPVCVDDDAEPNDTWDGAAELLPTVGTSSSFTFVAADMDWFYLDVVPDEQVEIVVRHDDPGVNLAVQAWDEAGLLADTVLDRTEELVLTVDGGSAGQMIDLLLEPTQPGTCAPYTVEVHSTLATCPVDAYEPNDVFAVTASAPVALTLTGDDVDRFAVELYPGESLAVDALFDHDYGDVELRIYDEAGFQVASSLSTSDDESVLLTHEGPFPATYTIELSLFVGFFAPDSCQDVLLDWVVFGSCMDDALEGDDTPAGAWELVPQYGTSTVYDLVADDVDWFYLSTLPGEAVDVYIHHDTPGAALELTAWDDYGIAGSALADLPYATGEAVLQLPITSSGTTYDLEVLPLDGPGTCLPYTLTVVSR